MYDDFPMWRKGDAKKAFNDVMRGVNLQLSFQRFCGFKCFSKSGRAI